MGTSLLRFGIAGCSLRSAVLVCAAALCLTARVPYARAQTPTGDLYAPLLETMRQQALELEKDGEITHALSRWEVVSALNPQDQAARQKMVALQNTIQSMAVANFKMAMASYNRGDRAGALKAFVKVLVYDPTNRVALRYIKEDLVGRSVEPYEVTEGDTLARIATAKYRDSSKAGFLAEYNDLKPAERLKPGQSLKIPVIADIFQEETGSEEEFRARLQQVKDLVAANKFPAAVEAADAMARQFRAFPDALGMVDTAYFKYAVFLKDARKFDEATAVLKRFNPKEKRVVQLKAQIAKAREEEAQKLYITGMKYFLDEDLEKAIQAWEKTLVLNPEHPKAGQDLQNARNIKKKLDNVE